MTHYNEVKTCRVFVHQVRALLLLLLVFGGGEAMAQVTIHGSVFGGGNDADVKTNTEVNISKGTVEGNVYGGGNLGDVGTHQDKSPASIGDYNWETTKGLCTVSITNANVTIGKTDVAADDDHGNVFGGGKGEGDTWECEKGMVYKTSVTISNGTVKGTVYGGGQVGRVEDDTEVTIGTAGQDGSTPSIAGNVFGAGKGIVTHGYSALVRGNSTVTVQGKATVNGSVYGGGEIATVGKYVVVNGVPKEPKSGGKTTVNIKDNATIAVNVVGAGQGVNPDTYVESGDGRTKRMMAWASRFTEDTQGSAWIYIKTYPENFTGPKYVWEYLSMDAYKTFLQTLALASESDVTIGGTNSGKTAKVTGNVYGGSESGFMQRHTNVTILDNCEIGTASANGNVYGGGKGLSNFDVAGRVSGYSTVTIDGIDDNSTIHGSVYGGGELGFVRGGVTVTLNGETVEHDVYGGGALANTNTANNDDGDDKFVAFPVKTGTSVVGLFVKTVDYKPTTDTTADVNKTYYEKDGNNNYVIVNNVYGDISDKIYYEKLEVFSDASGNAQSGTLYFSNTHNTTVNLLGGLIKGDAYGGGLGRLANQQNNVTAVEAKVYGDINVKLGKEDGSSATAFDITYVNSGTNESPVQMVNSGRVFGCNNLNGSPQGNVTVTAWKTVPGNTPRSETANKDNANATYEVAAVYGGGNLADYTAEGKKTHVIINGCDDTSIQYVYGGGNAAAVPETDVDINAAYELGYVFGGGNGKDQYTLDGTTWINNPGANVNGDANTVLMGGVIHEAFGGSNEKGAISGSVYINTGTNDDGCPLSLGKLYGAGKNADIEGDLIVILGCMPDDENKTDVVYGGAENANIKGNVELTITSGSFGKVFGGNNQSGAIFGHIKLNIEETGCTPIKIDELYLGGNNAAYSVYGYYHAKQYSDGDDLFMDAGKTIPLYKDNSNNLFKDEGKTISLYKADDNFLYLDEEKTKPLYLPRTSLTDGTAVTFGEKPHTNPGEQGYADPELNIISATYIGKVFGGGFGSGATLYGNPTVNINMIPGEYAANIDRDDTHGADNDNNALGEIVDVFGGGNEAIVEGNTMVNIGTKTTVTLTSLDTDKTKNVLGAYITGSVYGGGNEANVNGNTQVNICAKYDENDDEYIRVAPGTAGVTIAKDVFGAGKGINTDAETAMVSGNTTIMLFDGEVQQSVYGGGELAQVDGNTNITVNGGTIGKEMVPATETTEEIRYGEDKYGNVYGGGKGNKDSNNGTIPDATLVAAGLVTGNTNITISGGTILHNIYGGGAYGSVGTFNYDNSNLPTSLKTNNTGKATITITGGTIGYDGHENGMVFGSSRGDVGAPNSIDDKVAWVYDTEVNIGTSGEGHGTDAPEPQIKGSVYGSGENGHTYQNASVTIHSGKVGITETMATDPDGQGGALYPYRGNVYGGGCGTDTYKDNQNNDKFNPKAGFVAGNTTVLIDGGRVVRDVYGAGSMGSVHGSSLVTIDGNAEIGAENSGGGYVFAGARGNETLDDEHQAYVGSSSLTISGGTIWESAFGGGQNGIVKGAVTVNLTDGEVKHDVYGGGALAKTNTDYDATSHPDYTTTVTLGNESPSAGDIVRGTTIRGDLYGGGLGRAEVLYTNEDVLPEGKNIGDVKISAIAADVNGPVTVTVKGGMANNVFGCNYINGAPQKTVTVNIEGTADPTVPRPLPINNVYGGGNQAAYTKADPTHPQNLKVNISGGTIGNVFGGGLSAEVAGGIDVTVIGGTIGAIGKGKDLYGNVYGGGAMASTNTANWDATKNSAIYDEVSFLTTDVSSVAGLYTESEGVYTAVSGENPTAAANTKYYRKTTGGWADETNTSTTYKTNVTLVGGIIGNAYGGGLGNEDTPIYVYGDIYLSVNDPAKIALYVTDYGCKGVGFTRETVSDITVGTKKYTVPTTGSIFGCNNINGTPRGDVKVEVFSTRQVQLTESNGRQSYAVIPHVSTASHAPNATNEYYEIQAVYGGGNQADYQPLADKKTQVIIRGCDETSIEKVYGGGNSAAVPGTDVTIYGTFDVGNAFGGGNGSKPIYRNNTWIENTGSNVNGNTKVECKGGKIGQVFGGNDAKGNVTGTMNATTTQDQTVNCTLKITKLFGASNESNVDGDVNVVISSCSDANIEYVCGGSYNANVRGDINMTITSGILKNVYGGNDARGSIGGNVTVNIEENETCNPIIIQNLMGGGNEADYPGENAKRYKGGTYPTGPEDHPDSYTDFTSGTITVNIKSATRIGTIYGGGFKAHVNGNTEVNINMTKGLWAGARAPEGYSDLPNVHKSHYAKVLGLIAGTSEVKNYYEKTGDNTYSLTTDATAVTDKAYYTYYANEVDVIDDAIGTIGDVFGGGNEGDVYGDATVNIGSETKVYIMRRNAAGVIVDEQGNSVQNGKILTGTPAYDEKDVLGANITGDIFGGGSLAHVGNYHLGIVDGKTADIIDVVGNTNVNIGVKDDSGYKAVAEGTEKVKIAGNVFGGGKGAADSFRCGKAMVTGATNIRIGNGTIGNGTTGGNVYGGGKIGRVETNTAVTIGFDAGATSAPEIKGNVFGAGQGVSSHGYSALVRGNSNVIIQSKAKVGHSVYGGGEIASIGKYNVGADGMPHSLANNNSGYCNVTIQGNAEIGPDNMVMPTFDGNVFGAGKGILPGLYSYANDNNKPKRITVGDIEDIINSESDYFTFIETLSLATQTNVTIKDNAFVKGSVYGGSENGIVQHDTKVTIAGTCQIGAGYDTDQNKSLTKYTEEAFIDPTGKTEEQINAAALAECNHWTYNKNEGAPYDPYATADGKYPYNDSRYSIIPENERRTSTDGGMQTGSDGHTFYGNVFGGGSGKDPFAPGKWHRAGGAVYGDTYVNITGGHILTSVYGGNEHTDVGTYTKDANNEPIVPVEGGKCTVNMVGGTLGVPRTLKQIAAHPVTCYLFGAGKGDQRIFFNTWTNVTETEVNISGNARIYGSTFGGGEDGHVMSDAVTNIGGSVTIGETTYNHTGVKIGTWGTSYVDGNVFGGGRGFCGEALTAGTVGGNVDVNINGGTMLGSVYGGGRMASVGTYFTDPDHDLYGQFQENEGAEYYAAGDAEVTAGTKQVGDLKSATKTYGHVTVSIKDCTIGNANPADDSQYSNKKYSGNIYGGSMGRLELLDGTMNPMWPKLAQVKTTAINISESQNKETTITGSVFGGGEYGTVRENAAISITGGTITGSVYGGGLGSDDYKNTTPITVHWNNNNIIYAYTPMQWAGTVGGNTSVSVSGGKVKENVYGGGKLGSVGIISYQVDEVESATIGTSSDVIVSYTDKENVTKYYKYKNIVKHSSTKDDGALYDFGLSWPYEFKYVSCTPRNDSPRGKTSVSITGGQIGTDNATDDDVIGYVFGGGKGMVSFGAKVYSNNNHYDDITEQRYTEAFCANVKETQVKIDGASTKVRTVYGGGDDGHVYEDTHVTINNGIIGHSVFGGGKGTNTYKTTLWTPNGASYIEVEDQDAHSWTAGKVYGNTNVTINNGTIDWFVYGGGNMASVGKGNYAGGQDDYSTAGYGELGEKLSDGNGGSIWTANPTEGTYPYYFANSGTATVKVLGGRIGPKLTTPVDNTKVDKYIDKDGIPYGSVFGGSRGKAAVTSTQSPRYRYVPDAFLGYVNKAVINIGGTSETGPVSTAGPTIEGSVYGGGQDGHVRNSTEVKIFKGNMTGQGDYESAARSGHVFGAGSGIGKYTVIENNVEKKYCNNASGSVTCTTLIEVYGEGSGDAATTKIKGNIYGGGALASVGPPYTGAQNDKNGKPYNEYNNTTTAYDEATSRAHGSMSLTKVAIKGGKIDGSVYGASRGPATTFLKSAFPGKVNSANDSAENQYNPTKFATSIWTEVDVTGGTIAGNVYGGGEMGQVKESTVVNLTGGIITHDAYGGGKGTINAESSEWDIAADIGGNTTVELNKGVDENVKGCIVKRIFGCNDLNGTPKGEVMVHVYATQNKNTSTITEKYYHPIQGEGENVENETLAQYLQRLINIAKTGENTYVSGVTESVFTTAQATCNNGSATNEQLNTAITSVKQELLKLYDVETVYGGGNLAEYYPTNADSETEAIKNAASTNVLIEGCELTSIKQVYGGGNAASTPGTYVEVRECYEIDELFGGGNGKDSYQHPKDNKWYQNPGANVGYHDFTHVGTGTGEDEANAIAQEDNDNALEKTDRQNLAHGYVYGSGIAKTIVTGGRIHTAYGGSNVRGNIRAKAESTYQESGTCEMIIDNTYAASQSATTDAESVMNVDCVTQMDRIFGGSTNADLNNDVYLRISNGHYGQVFGGNDTNGAINGSITVVIEEGGCTPVVIDELYAGGYLAPYSIYGYKKKADGTYEKDANGRPIPLKAGDPGALSEENKRLHPHINIISATHIGDIYGGGYQAKVVGDPHINVNMKAGFVEVEKVVKTNSDVPPTDGVYVTNDNYVYKDANGTLYKVADLVDEDNDQNPDPIAGKTNMFTAKLSLGDIDNIYGGGNEADIIGDTYVEIGTGQWTNENNKIETEDASGNKYTYEEKTTGTWKWYDANGDAVKTAPTPARNAATITGNVFGGGKGVAAESGDDAFLCATAMIGVVESGEGSTNVIIGNGEVRGNVYGGGEIGRVEKNTSVTIGLATGTSAPDIKGSVFGAGKGIYTHGYSGLVRGNSTVTIQNHAKVGHNVYGGGEMASVGKYSLDALGMPVSLVSDNKGICTVVVKDYAIIGPDNMKMTADGGPDDTGYVFGACRGVLPYKKPDYSAIDGDPWRMKPDKQKQWFTQSGYEAESTQPADYEAAYLKYIETLALATQTDVTIEGHAFIKGSVYGGSENGIVQHNTHVTIDGDCQIGNGYLLIKENENTIIDRGLNRPYTSEEWAAGHLIATDADFDATELAAGLKDKVNTQFASSLPECASWEYKAPYASYDILDLDANSKPKHATDGHTFYGNVFGGGSGLFPYKRKTGWKPKEEGSNVDANGYSDGVWHEEAGAVYGNTLVEIKGGHILTSIYGGNEMTNVGKTNDANTGLSTVKMSGGTLGVPRTLEQIAAHPVTCYLFGAGKGDQRVNFNTTTNVNSVLVEVTDDARIYGSVFGGGEDGHVLGNVKLDIKTGKDITVGTGNDAVTYRYPYIGTTGTSYVDGNIFGAGRGFSGDALTAGSVGGNVEVNISDGTMLGSIYGGGRLASVGIGFNAPTDTQYGQFTEDDITAATYYQAGDVIPEGKEVGDEKTPVIFNKSYGHVTVNISGGIIGNDTEFKTPTAENTTPTGLNFADIDNWTDEDWNTWKTHNKIPYTEFDKTTKGPIHTKGGNVFGGSMGRLTSLNNVDYLPLWPQLGQVKRTTVNITGGTIKSNVYGGAEIGTVRDSTNVIISGGTVGRDAFGGGYGSIINTEDSKSTIKTVMKVGENNVTTYYGYTPIQWAGIVGMESNVNIYGGQVRRNLYGGGEMASVGIINYIVDAKMAAKTANSKLTDNNMVYYRNNPDSVYVNIIKHDNETNSFALSWPYEFSYISGYEGTANVTITGGRIGDLKGKEDLGSGYEEDNGDVYAAGKGVTGDRYEMAYCGNVGSTNLIINYKNSDASVSNYKNDLTKACIVGAAHGGAENGHVMGDTHVTMNNGLIVHSLYGGGNGKGTYPVSLLKIGATPKEKEKENPTDPDEYNESDYYKSNIYSLTAGKVFGNTYLTMNGGHVVRNVYGGGNIASVGKGNYAGARTTAETNYKLDDYSYLGYGERITTNLWDNVSDDSKEFLNSGKTNVTILGGKVGYVDLDNPKDYFKEGLPYGNVIGGSRGAAAPNVPATLTPRYHYCPAFFSGYVNETNVIIGTLGQANNNAGDAGKAPLIIGSVYGGGQDGHVRRDTHVTVYSGDIGLPFTDANKEKLEGLTITDAITQKVSDNPQWLFRGNVFGAGSGISEYTSNFEYVDNYPEADKITPTGYSTSAGSVTHNTTVDINGGIIHRNVYGGGSLASVGAPKIPIDREDDPDRTDATDSRGIGYESLNRVNIAGTIGTPDGYINGFKYDKSYGGEVYGASRGNDANNTSLATSVWTEVNLLPGAHVLDNVFGGGDNGMVKRDAEVNVGAPLVATIDNTDNIPAGGGSKIINVISSTTWKVTRTEHSEFTVSTASGSGNGTITVTANPNQTQAKRSITITITTAAGRTQTFTVTQAAAGQ